MIQEVYRESLWESAVISSDVIERMIRQGQFSMSRITVQISSKLAATKISLCLDDVETYTISRFPRSLLQEDNYKRGLLLFHFRWGSLLTISLPSCVRNPQKPQQEFWSMGQQNTESTDSPQALGTARFESRLSASQHHKSIFRVQLCLGEFFTCRIGKACKNVQVRH